MAIRTVCFWLTCLSLLAIAAIPPPVSASDIVGPELTISNRDLNQYRPSVAYNSVRDEYLVVWEDYMASGVHEIWGRRIGGDGTVFPDFAIAAGDAIDRLKPDVAYNPVLDHYLVVYQKEISPALWNIWGRRIPALGPDPVVAEDYVGLSSDSQTEPAVTYGRGAVVGEKFLVVWVEDPSPTPVIDQIYAAFVDGASGGADNAFPVTISATDCDEPEIAFNRSRSEFLVTYLKDSELKGKILNASGTAVHGGVFTIANPGTGYVSDNGGVSVYFPGDRYLATYQVDRFTDIDIGAQWVSGDAMLLGGGLPIPDAGLYQKDPDVACVNHSGHCLIVWKKQFTSTSGPYGVWAALAPMDGGLGTVIEIVTPSPFDDVREYPAVAGGALPFFVAWQHERDYSGWVDIHGRLADPIIFVDGFEAGNPDAWSSIVN